MKLGVDNVVAQFDKLIRSDSLENLATCAICLSIMFEPVITNCQHVFCYGCLKR